MCNVYVDVLLYDQSLSRKIKCFQTSNINTKKKKKVPLHKRGAAKNHYYVKGPIFFISN